MQTYYWIISLPVNIKTLTKYHPIAEIEYQILNNAKNPQPLEYMMDFTFDKQAEDVNSANDYFKKLADAIYDLQNGKASLTILDIGNLFYILDKFKSLQSPKETDSFLNLHRRLRETISLLNKIEHNQGNENALYIQVRKRRENNSNFPELVNLKDKNDIADVLCFLKEKYKKKITEMREAYVNGADLLIDDQLRRLLDIAVSVGNLNPIIIKKYQLTYKLVFRLLPKEIIYTKKYSVNTEFLRNLYRTLIRFLTKETLVRQRLNKQGKANKQLSLQFRVVHILCSMFELLTPSSDEDEQYRVVREIAKNAGDDERYKIDKHNKLAERFQSYLDSKK